jgi:hypothetical protein
MVHCLFEELLFGGISLGVHAAGDDPLTSKFKHWQPLIE